MRVVFLPSLIAPVAEGSCFGGAEVAALALAELIARRGHAVTLLGLAGSGGVGLTTDVVAEKTPLMRPGEATAGDARGPFPALEAHLAATAFDVLHLHLNDPPALLMADRIARARPEVKVISTLHMAAVFPETLAVVARLARERSPLVFTAPSRFALHSYGLDEVPTADRARDVVIPNGVDIARIPFLADTPRDATRDAPLAWAGRRSREKGLLAALELASTAGRRIMVAGAQAPEATREDQDQLARALAAPHVEDRGLLARSEVIRMFSRAAAVLVTSSIPESQSLVAVEALATGTPVIAFDTGALREVVADGETGFVVAPGDIRAAAAAVAEVQHLSRARCRESAAAKFDHDVAADRFLAIYKNGR